MADLSDHGRRAAAERRPLLVPRSRRLGRAILLGWLSVLETFMGAWRWLWDPRRTPGRLVRHLRLLMPFKTFGFWILLLLLFTAITGYLRFFVLEGHGPTVRILGIFVIETPENREPWKTITGTLATGGLVALLALLWNDLMRLPYLAWRIRRRVIGRPERVLMADLLARQGRPLVERIALDIVPRAELYADLLPGVLTRDRKDVQIIVGDAGAGKTTALLAISQLLAQHGIVPVLVPLRSHKETALIEPARERFKKQVEAQVRSEGEAEALWRWLVLRRRVAVLVDDIDQVGPDGERGLVMRRMLDESTESGLSVIVTARPAGVPAGIAASAIDLGPLQQSDAIEHVVNRAHHDRSFSSESRLSRRRIAEWVTEGELAEAPFYLELLASLAAVGQCPRLPQAGSLAGRAEEAGRVSRTPSGEWIWNPLWVRFRLLEHFYEQMVFGRVRRSLGIQPRERRSTLHALELAALGTLVASSLAARMKLAPQEISDPPTRHTQPLRQAIVEFIDTNDRYGLQAGGYSRAERERSHGSRRGGGSERLRVSAHEVIDAAERLSILDLRSQEDTVSFHHRIMQAYLAARCLAVREHELGARARNGQRGRENPSDRLPEIERDWIQALLDPAHPEKLTAHMALTFTAMHAREIAEAQAAEQADTSSSDSDDTWAGIGQRIVGALVKGAQAARGGGREEETEGDQAKTTVQLTTEARAEHEELMLTVALDQGHGAAWRRDPDAVLLEPLYKPDPEQRSDPDDALMKLTTAVEIARAVPTAVNKKAESDDERADVEEILKEVHSTPGPTRWTKLRAIQALAVPSSPNHCEAFSQEKGLERWHRIWEFARDRDYDVRRTASEALEENAYESFKTLADEIEELITVAAARSAYGRWLVRPERLDGHNAQGALSAVSPQDLITGDEDDLRVHDITTWETDNDIEALKALGSILPAIVSGFREDPSIELESALKDRARDDTDGGPESGHDGATPSGRRRAKRDLVEMMCHRPEFREDRLDYARRAQRALESLVALAFEGKHGDLESAVAQGFRSDALRHALFPQNNVTGPGWVNTNREMVAGQCLDYARFWYARIALYQALALYAIAGADAQDTFDVFARHLRRGGRDHHPFTRRAGKLARAAVLRSELRSDRWLAYVWGDESKDAGRRARQLGSGTAQLLADVTVLLNLNESSPEDRQDAFAQMQVLPYCLSGSRDRSEILGEGCPSRCGWGLCPYRQPPPDEPDAHRGVRRAFCRQQREIARWRTPPWQRSLHRRKLKEFWREMEMRART